MRAKDLNIAEQSRTSKAETTLQFTPHNENLTSKDVIVTFIDNRICGVKLMLKIKPRNIYIIYYYKMWFENQHVELYGKKR